MVITLGIVDVGPAGESTRHPPRFLASRRFGDSSLLEWVVRRITDCEQLDEVVVVCSDEPDSDLIRQYVPADVPVHVSEARDPLGRCANAIQEFAAESVVCASIGNPLIDPALIDRLVSSAKSQAGCDYVSYCLSDGQPAVLSHIGMLAEWCRGDAICRADRETTDTLDRENITRYVYRRPELFQLRLIPVPSQLDRADLRLGIDVEEDWENIQLIVDALGPESLEWQRIAGLLEQHPAIRQRMAVLNRTETEI